MEKRMVKIPSDVGDWAVDFERNTITSVDNPNIVVPLACRFSDQSGYLFGLDMKSGKLSDKAASLQVRIPHLLNAGEHCYNEFVRHYSLEGVEISGLTDHEAKKLQPALKERLALDEVTMEINGKLYAVDYYADAFMPTKGNNLGPIAFDDVKRFYDHQRDTCLFLLTSDSHQYTSELRQGLVLVETPHPFSLDPVRLGLSYDLDIYEKVMDHGPLKNHHVAKTMHVTENDGKVLEQNQNRRRGRRI